VLLHLVNGYPILYFAAVAYLNLEAVIKWLFEGAWECLFNYALLTLKKSLSVETFFLLSCQEAIRSGQLFGLF
jgi:hypothetical protein